MEDLKEYLSFLSDTQLKYIFYFVKGMLENRGVKKWD